MNIYEQNYTTILKNSPDSNLYNYSLWSMHAVLPQQARVQGGGPKGPGPPLEIKKKPKKPKFQGIHLYFASFLVENVIFSTIFCIHP